MPTDRFVPAANPPRTLWVLLRPCFLVSPKKILSPSDGNFSFSGAYCVHDCPSNMAASSEPGAEAGRLPPSPQARPQPGGAAGEQLGRHRAYQPLPPCEVAMLDGISLGGRRPASEVHKTRCIFNATGPLLPPLPPRRGERGPRRGHQGAEAGE